MKKSFKKAGATVLSMAMLLSMGAISMPVYAVDAPPSGQYNTGKPATVTVKIQGVTTGDIYYQGEGQKYDANENGDGSDSKAAANSPGYTDKYSYWDLQNKGVEGAKVTMYRLAQLTPSNGWQWEDYIREFMNKAGAEQLSDFTDFADLMKNKDLDPDDTNNDGDKSGITKELEFKTSSETLQHMASYFERIIESLKKEKSDLEALNNGAGPTASSLEATRLAEIKEYLADVTVASKDFTNDDAKNGITLPVTDANLLDKNKNGVLDPDEIALTQNVIGYYIIVTETSNSGAIVQPVLVCLKNGENKYIALKGSEIEFEKTMTKIESQDETDKNGANAIKDNDDDRFKSTAKSSLKNGLVAQDDIVHYQIVAQMPKYDENVKGGDITPFVITDTGSTGITMDISIASDTTIVDASKFEVILVDSKDDFNADGTLKENKGWKLVGSSVANVGDYQLTPDGNKHGFTLSITGYQMQEKDNLKNSGNGTGGRGSQGADGAIDDTNLVDVGTGSDAITGTDAGSMTLASRTKENNYGELEDMQGKYIYVNFQATVNKDDNGNDITDETKDGANGGLAFNRSFKEYYDLEDVTSTEFNDTYLAYQGTTGNDAIDADVLKQVLRVKLFGGETRYNQTYKATDYSNETFVSKFLKEGKTKYTSADDLTDAGKTLFKNLGNDADKFNSLFDVAANATATPPVEAVDNTNNRIKLLLARDKFNITRNGEYNTAKMTYGNRYATGGGNAQMNTNYSKVYSVDLELNKYIEILNLEATPVIQKNDVSYGKYAEPYVYNATTNKNPKTITLDKDSAADGEGTVTFTLKDYEEAVAAETGGTGNADIRTDEQKIIMRAVAAYITSTDATVSTANQDNGTGVDRVTGESVSPAGDGTTVKDSDASAIWGALNVNEQKIIAQLIADENRTANSQYKTVYDKQAVTGAIFHLVRNYTDDGGNKKTVDLGYAISTPTGELQKLTLATKKADNEVYESDSAITLPLSDYSSLNNIPNDCKQYVIKDGDKYLIGYVKVVEDTDPITNEKVIKEFKGDNTWRMLDEGDYTIYELSVPTGYKKWDSANFTISADQEGTTAKYLQPTAFLGSYAGSATAPDTSGGTGATSSSGFGSIKEQNAGGTVTFRYDTTTGTLSQDLYNEYLDQLPATGGMGTVLFTAGGIAVILMAGALFVVYMKKRNAEEEE